MEETNHTIELYDDPAYIGIQVACIKLMVRAGVIKHAGEYVEKGHAEMFNLFITGAARVATDDEVEAARTQVQNILTK